MSNYPYQQDTDAQLPMVNDDITQIGGEAINALRDAVFAIEQTLGLVPQGNMSSLASRLSTSLDASGAILPSSLAGIGLVFLPINDSEISPTAAIKESKLALNYSTQSLYNLYVSLNNSVDVLNAWLSTVGVQLLPHIQGSAYNHELSAILVDTSTPMLKTDPQPLIQAPGTFVVSRNTTNADTLIEDISNDLLTHEKADGNSNDDPTTGGTVPPQNFAHVSAGLYLNPTNFSTIPETVNSVQAFAEYVDNASLLLLGSRIQTLYSNGIPETARSTSLVNDGYGAPLVPSTPVIAYLLGVPPGPISSSPVDDFVNGDDVILFQPSNSQLSNYVFDSQFALVQAGDILTINYNNGSGLSFQFVIDSVKAQINGSTRLYAVRINGKNLFSSSDATARIDRSLFNREKYGILASASAPNNSNNYESLIVANPRSAIALGNGFNASEFDSTHYNLYLFLYPTGDPTNTATIIQLPAIDVTGNQGSTPGQYTLDTIINNANTAFRQPGFNYRFIAFQYDGQFGIMLADPYNNASFSIVGGSGVDTNGNYTYGSGNSNATATNCPNNVIDNPATIDPLGFGLTAAGIGTPPPAPIFQYVSAISANIAPLIVFYPLAKNYFYTNGAERDRLRSDPNFINQIIDSYGDGYWPGSIISRTQFTNRVSVSYQANFDLSTSGLKAGKTIVIQPAFATTDSRYNYRDYGRFIITDVQFFNCDTSNAYTIITVYDAVHASGISPASTSSNIPVNLYFSDDSVSFDKENVFDSDSSNYPYKRYFEIFVDQTGHTFSHERARFSFTGAPVQNINIINISPKLRGYPTNNDISIRLYINNFNTNTGIYQAQLARWNPSISLSSNLGPLINGKLGEITRVFDETNIDFIDFKFEYGSTVSSGSIDIQLFSSLQLDEEMMCISTCMISDSSSSIISLSDTRQFGNISEEQLSNSAISFITASDRLLRENGIVQGFDLVNAASSLGIGNQSAIIYSVISGVVTLTGISGASSGSVGKYITINNASQAANNGVFLISSFISSTSITYINPNAVAPEYNSGNIYWTIVNQPTLSFTGGSALIDGNIVNINNTQIEIPNIVEIVGGSATINTITWFLCASESGELQLVASTDFDPDGSAASIYSVLGLDENRLFYVRNPNNLGAGQYNIRATYLSNLVINYKDLTPLYVINATVGLNNGSSPYVINSINILDAKRYVSNGFNGLNQFVLGPSSNFRSISALDTWLTQLANNISAQNTSNNVGINVSVKGEWIINTTVRFDYKLPVIFKGDGGSFIIQANLSGKNISGFLRSGSIVLSNNITFKDINIDNQYDPTFSSGGFGPDNLYNTTYLCNYAEACVMIGTGNFGTYSKNITIDNCLFTSSLQYRFPFIGMLINDTNNYAQNINIVNNKIETDFAGDDLLTAIACVSIGATNNNANSRITGVFIENNICNKNQGIIFGASAGFSSGVPIINDLCIAVNCSVSNNVAGSIIFLNKKGSTTYPNNFAGSQITILDKDQGLRICHNTCKFIGSGGSNGLMGQISSGTFYPYAEALQSGLYLGSVEIYGNTVSWIHSATSASASCVLNVHDNIMTAFDMNFLTNFYISLANASNAAIFLFPPNGEVA